MGLESLQICMVDVVLNLQEGLLPQGRFQLTFPHSHDPPSHPFQCLPVMCVSLLVALNLFRQKSLLECGICPSTSCPCQKHPCMKITMPYLRSTMSGVPGNPFTFCGNGSHAKEVTAHNPLWLCVSTPYLRHDGGTLLLAPNIHTFQFVITQK